MVATLAKRICEKIGVRGGLVIHQFARCDGLVAKALAHIAPARSGTAE